MGLRVQPFPEQRLCDSRYHGRVLCGRFGGPLPRVRREITAPNLHDDAARGQSGRSQPGGGAVRQPQQLPFDVLAAAKIHRVGLLGADGFFLTVRFDRPVIDT